MLLVLLGIVSSCSQVQLKQPIKFSYVEGKEYIGTWAGQVLVVNVEATFTERTYQFKTISSNNIWFSGTRGEFFQTSQDMLLAKQLEYYSYDQETGLGEWKIADNKVFPIEWHVSQEDHALVLSPNASDFAIVLFKIEL